MDQVGDTPLLEPVPVLDTTKTKHVSQFGTIMNLINSLMGAGILSVSNSFTFSGFYPSFIILTLIATLSYAASCITVYLQKQTGSESFAHLAHITTGNIGSCILSICVALFCYSTMIAYLIIGSNILIDIFSLGGVEMPKKWGRPVLVLIFSLVLPVAMTVPKHLAILSTISTAAFGCIILFFISMIVKGIQLFPKNGISPSCESCKISLGLFNALAIYSLSFAMSVILLPIINPSKPRLKSRFFALGTSFFTCYILVLVPGVIGYLLFGADTKEVILDSFPSHDILMLVVKIGYFVILTASYPVIGFSVLATFGRTIYSIDTISKLSWKQRIVCLLFENVPPVLLAVVLPNVRPILAIGGALGGCMTNFFFPAIFAIILSPHKKYHYKNILLFLMAGFGLITTGISTYEGVLDAINQLK